MSKVRHFSSEADLVAKFCELVDHRNGDAAKNPRVETWTAYHETAGWDLLLVSDRTGAQIGVEAKLVLNAKVLEQSLPGRWADRRGPDFRAVLVPDYGLQHHLEAICQHLGIAIITVRAHQASWRPGRPHFDFRPALPDLTSRFDHGDWPWWMPAERCVLPEYVPDVTGGKAAPVQLSPWKIKAIKLLIVLERRGYVTRKDMAALDISPTRWTASFYGFLARGEHGYVRWERTPDLKAQHPTVWAQIEADFPKWSTGLLDLDGKAAA